LPEGISRRYLGAAGTERDPREHEREADDRERGDRLVEKGRAVDERERRDEVGDEDRAGGAAPAISPK